jgi:hypothetical protein
MFILNVNSLIRVSMVDTSFYSKNLILPVLPEVTS